MLAVLHKKNTLYEIFFNHFKENKVKIASAITKLFPFLESLRDRSFITNKIYTRVVYNVLCRLEERFDCSLLEVLFSRVNLKEYPELIEIHKSFENVLQDKYSPQKSDGKETQKKHSIQPDCERGNGENSFPSLPGPQSDSSFSTGTTPPESGLLEHLCETEQANARRNDTAGDKNDALGCQEANQQCAQEPEPAESCGPVVTNGDARKETPSPLPCDEPRAELPSQRIQINSCFVCLVDIMKKKPPFNSEDEQQAQARTNRNQAPDIIVISSEDSEESSDGDEPPGAPISALENPENIRNMPL
ncbi:nuclear autoantigen Sp-100-like [Lemur catta]|uniref:nuclear autoantigen Sp-100-like n=1 Tax=Lemur catta TaxID=9447 RepID=UPI001E26A76B|nr:nuclear autoantigen Sp-100-like [Lemur catta]